MKHFFLVLPSYFSSITVLDLLIILGDKEPSFFGEVLISCP